MDNVPPKDQLHVEQLFHAIARRDPSKRQIKPVVGAQFELFDDLDDESDDEFVCEEVDDEETDLDESEGNESSSTTSESASCESLPKNTKTQYGGSCEEKSENGLAEPTQSSSGVETRDLGCIAPLERRPVLFEQSTRDFLVCLLCLSDKDEPDDELIECDGCGIVVHEDCYKVVDSIFLSSGASSSSTDAWFCEPCLAGVSSPHCELCPNLSGAFKRTDNNRWVHLLCALYTPGVAFNDPETLMDVTLTELPSKMWSSHECSLCDERFFAWTGVCISCDAGLCRTYFHVTCAQKYGLLSEPAVDENALDPYFAHCRQHTDKTVARQRRRNYLAAMSRLKSKRSCLPELNQVNELGLIGSPTETSTQKEHFPVDPRVQRKLEHFRHLYEELRKIKGKPFVPTTKTPLFLEHSPVAMRLFVTKAKSLQLPLDLTGHSATNDATKAPPSGYPVFAPDFINYFFDREKKIADALKRISSLQDAQRELQVADASASHSYNSVAAQLDAVSSKRMALSTCFQNILAYLQQLIPELQPAPSLQPVLQPSVCTSDVNSVSFTNEEEAKATKILPRPKRTLPLRLASNISSTLVSNGVNRELKRKVMDSHVLCKDSEHINIDFKAKSDKLEPSSDLTVPDNIILECFVCHGLQDQHLITKCDTCGKAFHLACLDPPMTRMPKRTRLYGWQCSYCTKAVSANTEQIHVDLNAPRQLRRSAGRSSSQQTLPVVELSMVSCDQMSVSVSSVDTSSKSERPKSPSVSTTLPDSLSAHLTRPVTVHLERDGAAHPTLIKPKQEVGKFDAYEYRVEPNSDEDITGLRASKVIKFEQIRHHSRHNDSESVEQIAPLHMRYVICPETNHNPSGQKKSSVERFRMKLKKL